MHVTGRVYGAFGETHESHVLFRGDEALLGDAYEIGRADHFRELQWNEKGRFGHVGASAPLFVYPGPPLRLNEVIVLDHLLALLRLYILDVLVYVNYISLIPDNVLLLERIHLVHQGRSLPSWRGY